MAGMKVRTCVVGLISKKGKYLIAKMPKDLGVFPGQWAIPGGGLDEGETMEEGLRREMREEVGLEISDIRPFYFRDDRREKLMRDGSVQEVYMVYLVFECEAVNKQVELGDEFEEYVWVELSEVFEYELNEATRDTFERLVAKQRRAVSMQAGEGDLHRLWSENPEGLVPRGSVCPCCGRFNARDSVVNVMAWKAGKVLMVKRDIEPSRGMWALPGGYVDWNEALEDAARRELKEEAGVEAGKVELYKVYSLFGEADVDGRQNIVHMYTVEVEGEGRALDEVTQVGWFEPDKLPEKVAFEHDKVVLEYVESD